MDKRDRTADQTKVAQNEDRKRILDRTDADRLQDDAARSYRAFVDRINKTKDSEIERALFSR